MCWCRRHDDHRAVRRRDELCGHSAPQPVGPAVVARAADEDEGRGLFCGYTRELLSWRADLNSGVHPTAKLLPCDDSLDELPTTLLCVRPGAGMRPAGLRDVDDD